MNSNALDPLQQVIDTEGKLLIAGQWVEGAGASIHAGSPGSSKDLGGKEAAGSAIDKAVAARPVGAAHEIDLPV